MNEYTLSPVVKTLGYIATAALLIGGCCLLYYTSTHTVTHSIGAYLIPSVFCILMGFYLFRICQRSRVTVDESTMTVQTVWRTDEIELRDIDGYRRGDKNAFFIIRKDNGRSVILPQNLSGRKDLINWIELHYEDVDARAREAETRVLLEDERYGQTREDRESALQKAQMIGKVSTAVGFILLVWVMVFPEPYPWPIYLALAAPWVGVYLTWSFKGLVRLTSTKSRPYPTAFVMLLLPSVGLAIIAFKYDLYAFPPAAWLTLIGTTLLLTGISLNVLRPAVALEGAQKNTIIAGMVIAIAIYSYGGLIFSNCYYDHSEPQVFLTTVTGKHFHHGKGTTYYLNLAPWGKHANGSEETVNSGFYNSVIRQDTVQILLNPGRLGIPWYRLANYYK